jgi:hypothetical protein
VRKQVVGAAVQGRGRDDVVARLGDGHDRVGDGCLAGRQRQRADTALERSDTLLQHVAGRIHDARVDVALNLEVEQVCTVLGVVEGVAGGLIDGHRNRPRRPFRRVTRVDGEGLEFHAGSPW